MYKSVSFPPEADAFFKTVKECVHMLFVNEKVKKQGNAFFYLKAILFIAIYIGLYLTLLFSENAGLAFWSMVLMGPMAILIGINVAHDAAHGAILPFADVIQNHKYTNTYDYHRAIFMLNKQPFLESGFLIFKEGESLHTPVSVIQY